MSLKGSDRARQDLVRRHPPTAASTPRKAPDRPWRQVARQGAVCGGLFTKGDGLSGSLITSATSVQRPLLALQDVRYAADASAGRRRFPITNGSTPRQEQVAGARLSRVGRCREQIRRPGSHLVQQTSGPTRRTSPSCAILGRKVVVVITGWRTMPSRLQAASTITSAWAAAMGGHAEVQKFMHMYLLPGAAQQLAGPGPTTVGGRNDARAAAEAAGGTPTRHRRASRISSSPRWSIGLEKGVAPRRDSC